MHLLVVCSYSEFKQKLITKTIRIGIYNIKKKEFSYESTEVLRGLYSKVTLHPSQKKFPILIQVLILFFDPI